MAFLSGIFLEERTNVLRFRAGKMWLEKNRMHADFRQGWFCLYESDDFVYHCWKDRRTGILENETLLIPEEAEFVPIPECKTGRAYTLKFLHSGKRLFFWMQEKDATKDAELCKKVNEILKYAHRVQKRGRFADMIRNGRVSPSQRGATPTGTHAKLKCFTRRGLCRVIGNTNLPLAHFLKEENREEIQELNRSDDSENYDLDDEEDDERIVNDEKEMTKPDADQKNKEQKDSKGNRSVMTKQSQQLQPKQRPHRSSPSGKAKVARKCNIVVEDDSNRKPTSRNEKRRVRIVHMNDGKSSEERSVSKIDQKSAKDRKTRKSECDSVKERKVRKKEKSGVKDPKRQKSEKDSAMDKRSRKKNK